MHGRWLGKSSTDSVGKGVGHDVTRRNSVCLMIGTYWDVWLIERIFSHLHDDPYMEIMQAYDATDNELPIPPLQAPIAPPTVVSPSPVLSLSPMFDSQDFFPPKEISPPKDIETGNGYSIKDKN
ncbi:hypothetical protein Tco_0962707 [Tanacetum coccineum]